MKSIDYIYIIIQTTNDMTTANPYSMNQVNSDFFLFIDDSVASKIILDIAKHYGISKKEAWNEVLDPEAENIMDYVTVDRQAVSFLYNKFKTQA